MKISRQQAEIIGQVIFNTILNQSFAVSSKKEYQINLLRAMVKANVFDLNNGVSTEVALQLGMDPRHLERLLYATYLGNLDLQDNGLAISREQLQSWNATTTQDVNNQEIRFEVPSQIARVKLEQYFKNLGIQAENGRNNYILMIRVERLVSVLHEESEISNQTMNLIREQYESVANLITAAPTAKEKRDYSGGISHLKAVEGAGFCSENLLPSQLWMERYWSRGANSAREISRGSAIS